MSGMSAMETSGTTLQIVQLKLLMSDLLDL